MRTALVERSTTLVAAILVVLAAASVYEALVALRVIGLGSLPGEGPRGGEIVGVAAAVGFGAAVLAAGVLAGFRDNVTPLSALLAPATAAFLLVHFHSFDSYYSPNLNRYSNTSWISPIAVFVVAGLSIAAGLLTWKRRSVGLVVSGPLIFACGVTAWLVGVGH